ncbi:MAG: hypothetical protein J6Y20_03740 [Lachnospiraceae bacterium]|nr:hypothetical protein [Lachnospiraceae bacterium]
MPDYNTYCKEAGITNKDMIAELKKYYPRYGKPVQSMITHPEKYGVQLVPEAEARLMLSFGEHKGLSDSWCIIDAGDLPKETRRAERRTKANKLTVRLDDSLFTQLRELYGRTAFSSMQDMVEAAIVEFLNRRNG